MLVAGDLERALGAVGAGQAPWISSGAVALPDGRAGSRTAALVRDPDGHALRITVP